MDDERIDFSPLDPARSPQRWEALLQRTVAASLPQADAWWLSLGKMRLAVAGLAAVALLAWAPLLILDAPATAQTADPALALVQYSHAGDLTALLESTDGY